MAGDRADRYIGEVWLPSLEHASRAESSSLKDIRAAFALPYNCVNAFFAHYAFARRGKDRDELAQMATQALRRTCAPADFAELLAEPDGNRVWENFSAICEERKRKNSEQLNRGLIAGIVELAQEIYQLDSLGSIAGWIVRGVLQTDHIEPQFLRIVDIRGVGPKTTSMFLRDVCYLFNLEDQLDHADRLYIQPIDRWLRLAAAIIVPEIDSESAVDWVIAGKLAKYTRHAGVSGIRFNMGTSHFGAREVRDPERWRHCIDDLLDAGARTNA
ncbi:MAG: hypothetical protein K1X67_04240 [Fimbriimonadaceae bacterium]|nr:hypothetical protein [Fimbriimonadaceae bacterium]